MTTTYSGLRAAGARTLPAQPRGGAITAQEAAAIAWRALPARPVGRDDGVLIGGQRVPTLEGTR
jgi:hypothetical protein